MALSMIRELDLPLRHSQMTSKSGKSTFNINLTWLTMREDMGSSQKKRRKKGMKPYPL